MRASLAITGAYLGKRWTLSRLKTVRDVKARQERLLARQLAHIAHMIPFYRSYAGKSLSDWPILDKAQALAYFSSLNAHGVTAEEAWRIAEKGLVEANHSGRLGSLTIGTSSGTSGNRGLFLISDSERYQWLGSILARALPSFPFTRHRIAVMLATGNSLYETTQQSDRLTFGFFDLRQGIEVHRRAMESFAPDVIVAPPKALRILAEETFNLKPAYLFAGGEVLDALDSTAVIERYGVAPRSVYQATEGFIGIACPHGTIHLNEDDMLIEREAVPGHPDRFVPVITDLRRRSQAMIRYRLNDILVPSPQRCACGSPLQAIERIEGRCDDVVEIPRRDGGSITLMPDTVRATILDAERRLTDFRFDQVGAGNFVLRLPRDAPANTEAAAVTALQAMFDGLRGAIPVCIDTVRGIDEPLAGKLRRIRQMAGKR